MELTNLIYVFLGLTVLSMLGCIGVLVRSLWVDIKTITPMQRRQDSLYVALDKIHRERAADLQKISELEKKIVRLRELEGKVLILELEVGKRDSKILELQDQVVALQSSLALKENRILELENERSARCAGTNPLKPL